MIEKSFGIGRLKMRSLSFIVAISLLGFTAARSPAQTIATTYGYEYIAAQTAYSAPVSSDVTVNLYLQETNSDQSSHSLLASEHGLTSAGIQVNYLSGDSSAVVTACSTNTGLVPTGFDDGSNNESFTSSGAMISESTDPPPFGTDAVGVEAGPQVNGVSTVFLGSIRVHTGSTADVTTTFSVATTDSTFGATFTNDNNYDLDNSGFVTNPPGASTLYTSATPGQFTITTSAVPEPGLLGLLITVPLIARHRRQ